MAPLDTVEEGEACPDCPGTTTDGLLDDDNLARLSDALEDAGCTDARILGHLRGWEVYPKCGGEGCSGHGPVVPWVCDNGVRKVRFHVKGCWALDLVLGKE